MAEPSHVRGTTASRVREGMADRLAELAAADEPTGGSKKPAPLERKKSGKVSRRGLPHHRGAKGGEQVVEVIDEVARSQEMVAQLLAKPINPEMEEAKAEALAAEVTLVKAIEVAMVARQESAQVKDELERVRAELAAANAKSRNCTEELAKAIEAAKKAETAAAEAKDRVTAAIEETARAEKAAIKAVSDSEAAVAAVETAQTTTQKAAEAYEKAQAVTKTEDENVKGIRKAAERAQWLLDDAKKAEASVVTSIPKLEGAALTKQQKASEVSRASHKLRMEV